MQSKRKKHPLRFVVWLMILVALGIIGFNLYFIAQKGPVDSNGTERSFEVKEGQTVSEVASQLEADGLIHASWVFKQEFKNNGKETIAAGTYKLSPSMNLQQIIEALTSGASEKWVTLLEGWRDEQMAQKLSAELGIKSAEFLDNAKEGYMFPDTYDFDKDVTAEQIALTMKTNFNNKYDSALQSKMKARGLTAEQGVILASLVEREARSDEIRTQVAGVILKRLKMGMKLDIDSTVQYAKDTQSYKQNPNFKNFWAPVTQADYTNVDSPYNTYLNNGLPPGPICNPSLSSLNAVANANPNTQYLFYYHDSQGNTYYAKTLEEHNVNVAAHP